MFAESYANPKRYLCYFERKVLRDSIAPHFGREDYGSKRRVKARFRQETFISQDVLNVVFTYLV